LKILLELFALLDDVKLSVAFLGGFISPIVTITIAGAILGALYAEAMSQYLDRESITTVAHKGHAQNVTLLQI
jgi:hypothetical protein